jgi:hypothetical protein
VIHIIDAIARFGAKGRLNTVVTDPKVNVVETLQSSTPAIIGCGGENGFLARSIETGMRVDHGLIDPGVWVEVEVDIWEAR